MIAWFTPVLAAIGIWDAVRTKAPVWAATGRTRLGWIIINLVPASAAVTLRSIQVPGTRYGLTGLPVSPH